VAYENQTAWMLIDVNFDDIFLIDLYDNVLDDLSLLDFFLLGNLLGVLWFDHHLFDCLLWLLLSLFLFVVSVAVDCILSFLLIV